jgi:iron(III) transport system ATP-binding protein
MSTAPILDVRKATRRYGDRVAVQSASFQLEAGRIACLLGPSGCGKTTLLRMIAGLEPLDEGRLMIDGAPVSAPGYTLPPESRGVGLVFQDFALFPHLDVTDNACFGIRTVPRKERQERVGRLLERFHVGHLARAWPHTLSGGEQQRVAIVRALAREPAILLLDEPFSGLDGQLRAKVRESVVADLRAAGTSVLIVTHDPEEAMLIADDMILMAGGRLLQTGSPEDCYHRPSSLAAARLLGDVVALPSQVEAGRAITALGSFPADGRQDGPACILTRPEALRLGEGGKPARVLSSGFAGACYRVELECDGIRLAARSVGTPPPVGATVDVSLDPGSVCVVDPA